MNELGRREWRRDPGRLNPGKISQGRLDPSLRATTAVLRLFSSFTPWQQSRPHRPPLGKAIPTHHYIAWTLTTDLLCLTRHFSILQVSRPAIMGLRWKLLIHKLTHHPRSNRYHALPEKPEPHNGTFPFFALPQEIRDIIYDNLLGRPSLQLISSSNFDIFLTSKRRPNTDLIPGLYKAIFGTDAHRWLDLALVDERPQPSYGRMRRECCLAALLVCRRMCKELTAREIWRARDNEMLLALGTGELLDVPETLVWSNPGTLHLRLILRSVWGTTPLELYRCFVTLQLYAERLAAQLPDLRRLAITIQMPLRHKAKCGQLITALEEAGVLINDPPWPPGTELAIDCFEEGATAVGKRWCPLSLAVEGGYVVFRPDRQAMYYDQGHVGWRSFYRARDSWSRKVVSGTMRRVFRSERVALEAALGGVSNLLM